MPGSGQSESNLKNDCEQEGLFFACIHGSSDAILLTDSKGCIFYVNPAWQKLFGYTSEEAIGKTPGLLRTGLHEKAFYEKMWSDILDSTRASFRGEVVNLAKDGKEIPVLLTISPFTDIKRQASGFMSIAVDLSAQKKKDMRIQWQDRLATLGLLAEGLAHEMGTPLGVARGRAEYLMRLSAEDSLAKTSLSKIVTQIDRVSKLMEALQDLSSQNTSEVAVPVQVAKVVEAVQQLLRGRLHVSGIHFESSVPHEAFILGDSAKLAQVVLNLCMNSYQALQERRKAGGEGAQFIRVSAVENGPFWEVAVADSGGGIAEENVLHLFKPFFTTKGVGVGTGLGLAAVNQVVSQWGGHIDLENSPGLGATFKLMIPKANVGEFSIKKEAVHGGTAPNSSR